MSGFIRTIGLWCIIAPLLTLTIPFFIGFMFTISRLLTGDKKTPDNTQSINLSNKDNNTMLTLTDNTLVHAFQTLQNAHPFDVVLVAQSLPNGKGELLKNFNYSSRINRIAKYFVSNPHNFDSATLQTAILTVKGLYNYEPSRFSGNGDISVAVASARDDNAMLSALQTFGIFPALQSAQTPPKVMAGNFNLNAHLATSQQPATINQNTGNSAIAGNITPMPAQQPVAQQPVAQQPVAQQPVNVPLQENQYPVNITLNGIVYRSKKYVSSDNAMKYVNNLENDTLVEGQFYQVANMTGATYNAMVVSKLYSGKHVNIRIYTTATQQPVAQQPVAQQPVAQQPVAQQPVAQQPVAQQPVQHTLEQRVSALENGITELLKIARQANA